MKLLEHYDLNNPKTKYLTCLDNFQQLIRRTLDQDGSWVLELHLASQKQFTLCGPEGKRPPNLEACDALADFILEFLRGDLLEPVAKKNESESSEKKEKPQYQEKQTLRWEDWARFCRKP